MCKLKHLQYSLIKCCNLFNFKMRLQSHEDCRPVLIIRYQPKDKTVAVLRSVENC